MSNENHRSLQKDQPNRDTAHRARAEGVKAVSKTIEDRFRSERAEPRAVRSALPSNRRFAFSKMGEGEIRLGNCPVDSFRVERAKPCLGRCPTFDRANSYKRTYAERKVTIMEFRGTNISAEDIDRAIDQRVIVKSGV